MIAGLKCPPEMWLRAETMTADDEPEGQCDLEVAGAGVGPDGQDRSAADEDERERADELGDRAPEDVGERRQRREQGHRSRDLKGSGRRRAAVGRFA